MHGDVEEGVEEGLGAGSAADNAIFSSASDSCSSRGGGEGLLVASSLQKFAPST